MPAAAKARDFREIWNLLFPYFLLREMEVKAQKKN